MYIKLYLKINNLIEIVRRFIMNTCVHCNEGRVIKGQKLDIFGGKLQIYKCTKCGVTGF
jgi:hypothetical protein